jgi:glycosyltransferase involved in cell wall biosynthesis
MPRLLLITFHYPPRHTIGSIRPGALAKYLPQFGWEVVVVTPGGEKGARPAARVIETAYEDGLEKWKRRIPGLDPHKALQAQLNLPKASKPREESLASRGIKSFKSLLAYPDVTQGWVRFAINAVKQMDEPVDAILSTAPPITTHLIAQEAKRKFKCPWIADFRDLWATNLDNPHGKTLQFFDRRLERKCLRSADVLVTVSRPWADRLQDSYPEKPVQVITNGFDPDDFARVSAPNRYFSISYTGQLYAGRRDPTQLFEVMQELLQEGLIRREKLRISFYGPIEAWTQPLIERYGLQGVVELHGSIEREQALRRQQESQILLLLGWANPQETGQHTGKLFEYFGARRPILAVGGVRGVLTETLEETGAGLHALSKLQLRQFLLQSYAEFEERGEVRFRGNEHELLKYTHAAMAGKFSALLNAYCGREAVAAASKVAGEPAPALSAVGDRVGG